MRTLTLADSSDTLALPDRPTGDDYTPLPYGLTLGEAVAVRAHEVKAGDLVVAEFPDESGIRQVEHIPTPFPADPHTLRDCPCQGCEECDDVDDWTLANHGRIADLGWRFVCLAPSEDDEPCALTLRQRPIAVIPAAVVATAQASAEEPPEPLYTVVWSCDFEASSPQEAAQLAYEQLKSYATDGWPPVLEVTNEDGRMTAVDLNATKKKGEDQ